MSNKNNIKGIVLAGGSGTRLYPASLPISKILLPVYDKPMIYYPIATLMLAGIRDIMIISNPRDIGVFKNLFENNNFGVNFEFAIQHEPKGIADSLIIAEEFIGQSNVALVLGDNIFHGSNFAAILKRTASNVQGATVFGYYVNDPERFGVAEFDENKNIISLEEKPVSPKSNYAVTGLYFYDNNAPAYARSLKPSARGELEITDLNKVYLNKGSLKIEILDKDFAWLDTGTHESLLEASNFVRSTEALSGEKVACLELIALNEGFIDKDNLLDIVNKYKNNDYYDYIKKSCNSRNASKSICI